MQQPHEFPGLSSFVKQQQRDQKKTRNKLHLAHFLKKNLLPIHKPFLNFTIFERSPLSSFLSFLIVYLHKLFDSFPQHWRNVHHFQICFMFSFATLGFFYGFYFIQFIKGLCATSEFYSQVFFIRFFFKQNHNVNSIMAFCVLHLINLDTKESQSAFLLSLFFLSGQIGLSGHSFKNGCPTWPV